MKIQWKQLYKLTELYRSSSMQANNGRDQPRVTKQSSIESEPMKKLSGSSMAEDTNKMNW